MAETNQTFQVLFNDDPEIKTRKNDQKEQLEQNLYRCKGGLFEDE